MDDSWQQLISKVVSNFRSKYRLTPDEAADLQSDIILRLLELEHSPDGARLQDEKYLRTVINNVARDFLRSKVSHDERVTPIDDARESATSPFQTMGRAILLGEVMAALSPLQRSLVSCRFGLDGNEPIINHRKLATLCGLSRAGVRQQLAAAIEVMSHAALRYNACSPL